MPLRAILLDEGLLKTAADWKMPNPDEGELKTDIGTYYYLEGEGVIFEPSRPFWDVLETVEDHSIPSWEMAKRWQSDHYAKNKGSDAWEHPEIAALRAEAQLVAIALKRMFRRKVEINENMRKRQTSVGVTVSTGKNLDDAGSLDAIAQDFGKRLRVQLKRSGGKRQRRFPDPVEAETHYSGQLNGRKINVSFSHQDGILFLVYVSIYAQPS